MTRFIRLVAATSLLLMNGLASAAGLLIPTNTQLQAPQIKSHKVDVMVEDGYAITRIDQVFHNPNPTDIEATYAFPVPEKGTVSGFTYWIDGQPVEGEVVKKQRATEIYELEKNAGREAGITEKKAHLRFEVKVTPVRATSDTRIRLTYMQAVDIDTGIGRFVYPLEEGGTDEQAMAFWTMQDKVEEAFSFNFKLRSSHPVSAVRLPSHPQAKVNKQDDQKWQVVLHNTQHSNDENLEAEITESATTEAQAFRLDKDIVVYWRLQDGLPASVDLVTYKEGNSPRGTFMLTMTPADDLTQINEGRDWIFVLDMSGSMKGKYQTLADGVSRALGKLSPHDRFRIVRFDSTARELTNQWVNASNEAVNKWGQRLANTSVGGGTNLYAGLNIALKSADTDRTTAVVLVTDGVANVGITEKKDFLELLKNKDIRLFTAVMGNGANRPLLTAMAKVSNGFSTSVSNSDDITGKLLEFVSKVTHEAMHDVEVNIKGIKVGDLTPAHIGSLYRGEQLTVFGHYWDQGAVNLDITAKVSGQAVKLSTTFEFPAESLNNPEIERLWAYAAIQDLKDQMAYLGSDPDAQDAISDLAIEYGLVTDYTSMIVLREEQYQAYGIDRTNRDRLQKENAAAQRRAQEQVNSRRVDAHAPISQGSRATHSTGGGALGLPFLLIALLTVRVVRNRKPYHQQGL